MVDKGLITYCGAYCGLCARYHGYTAFREAISMVSEIADAHGFQYWMPGAVKDFDYTEFRKGLAFFSDAESWLVCRNCCKGGDGRPDCPMRNCCQERGLDICFACSDFPCNKVAWNPNMIKRAEEYKKLGKDEWLRTQMEKANQGLELHTGKYYQAQAGVSPPDSL
jgi:hypothetical protein